MPTRLELGVEPLPLSVTLSEGGRFVQTLRTKDGSDWPTGAHAELKFDGGTTWAAVVVDDMITWDVSRTTVEALGYSRGMGVSLVYGDEAADDIVWATGEVAWRRQ